MDEAQKKELLDFYNEYQEIFVNQDTPKKVVEKKKRNVRFFENTVSLLKKKNKKIKLIKTNPFLFILSKKQRLKEYKNNIDAFGYPLNLVPLKYRTLEICKASIKHSPEDFDISYIPHKYLNKEFYKYCLECKVKLRKIPNEVIDLDLCKIALEHGTSLSDIPDRFIDVSLCEFAVKANAYNVKQIPFGTAKVPNEKKNDFYILAWNNGLSIHSMPEDYISRQMCEEKINQNPRYIFNIPKIYQDLQMWEFANSKGLPVNLIPNDYRESFSLETFEEEIKRDYKNIDVVPKKYLNSHMYVLALESGMPFEDIPSEFIDRNVCLAYVKKYSKIDRKIIRKYADRSFYEEIISFDANNLRLVPYIKANGICERTKKMCVDYVKQKHTINFGLFPKKFLNPKLILSLHEDAVKYRDILDGNLNFLEYTRLKSLNGVEQVIEYENLLEAFYQERLLNDEVRISGATDEEMKLIENSESFNLIKNLDVNQIFCDGEEVSPDFSEELSNTLKNSGIKIAKEDIKLTYLTKKSTNDEIKEVATDYKQRIDRVVNNADMVPETKRILVEAFESEINDILSCLDEQQRAIFNNDLSNYYKDGNFDYNGIFQVIKPPVPYNDDDDEIARRIKEILNDSRLK